MSFTSEHRVGAERLKALSVEAGLVHGYRVLKIVQQVVLEAALEIHERKYWFANHAELIERYQANASSPESQNKLIIVCYPCSVLIDEQLIYQI